MRIAVTLPAARLAPFVPAMSGRRYRVADCGTSPVLAR